MADPTIKTEMAIPASSPAAAATPTSPSAVSTPAPSAVEDPIPPQAKIPPPPGPLLAAKAGTVNKLLAWNPDDFIIANRTFRIVYSKYMLAHRDKWSQLPPGVVDTAVQALKSQNPRLFAGFENDWYPVWGLNKRHGQRWRQTPPE